MSGAFDPSTATLVPDSTSSAPSSTVPTAASVAASGGASLPVPTPAASSNTTAFDPSTAQLVPDGSSSNGDVPQSLLQENVQNVKDVPRALMTGVAGLAGFVGSGIKDTYESLVHPEQMAEEAVSPTPPPVSSSDPSMWAQDANSLANRMGLPAPKNANERIVSAAVSAVPSAILTPEAPVSGGLASAASGAASQGVAEEGGGPVAQTIAGLAAGGLPAVGAGAAGLARGMTRGFGEDAAARMSGRVANAAANDTPLTVGQAAGHWFPRALEATARTLWGGGHLHTFGETQNAILGSRVNDIADSLSAGGDVSPTGAGNAIQQGITNARSSMRAAESAAYDAVDQHVPAQTPINVSGTLARLDALAAPIPGAEPLTDTLVPGQIADIHRGMHAAADPNGGTLPYAAVRALRTRIGNSIDRSLTPSNPVQNGQLKQVYGQLTQDLNAGASAVSPEAAAAVKSADALYQANSARRTQLNSVLNTAGGPEAVYQAAMGNTKLGATKIAHVMGALDSDSQNLVRATVLDRMGKAPPSERVTDGDNFNLSSFLTRWTDLSPQAKDALFGQKGNAGTLRSSLDSLTDTLSTLRKGGALKNPSGTGPLLGHIIGAGNMISDVLIGIWTGHPIALTGFSAPAFNMALSRALTSPRLVRWLATATRLPQSVIPGAVAALQRASAAHGNQAGYNLAQALQSTVSQSPSQPPAGAEVRSYQGDRYYLRPGTDRRQRANWVKLSRGTP